MSPPRNIFPAMCAKSCALPVNRPTTHGLPQGIQALEEAQPDQCRLVILMSRLGASWVPAEIIQGFVADLLAL